MLNIVQTKSPWTGLYVRLNRKRGEITGRKKTPGPYKGIPIARKRKGGRRIYFIGHCRSRMKHYESNFDNSNIMDTDDVAEMFRFHRITILKLFREGTLPAVRVGPEWRAWRPNLIKLIKKGGSA